MGREKNIIGIMLSDSEARVVWVEQQGAGMDAVVHAVRRIPLNAQAPLAERLRPLEAELYAAGCTRGQPIWLACSLPAMRFSTVQMEPMPLSRMVPVAWMKFRKAVENLPDKVVFDFEVPREESEGVVPLLDLAAFAAPYEDVAPLEAWFATRYNLRGITMDMFACRNLLPTDLPENATVALLSCEQNLSRIMHIKKGQTDFTRTIKTGAGTLLEHVARKLDRTLSADKVLELLNMSQQEFDLHVDPDKNRIFDACAEGAERLFIQVGRALDYYTNHLKNTRPVKLYLTGDMELLKRFIPELSNRLMLEVELLDPVQTGVRVAEELSEGLGAGGAEPYSAAIGAALGRAGGTSNFLCTHDVKDHLQKIARIRRSIASGFILVALLMAAGLAWQLHQVQHKSQRLQALEARRTDGMLEISAAAAREQLEALQHKHLDARRLAKRYALISALGEIQQLTPEGILLNTLTLKGGGATRNNLVLEGVITGDERYAAMHLAKYVVELNGSSLFAQVTILSEPSRSGDAGAERPQAVPFRLEGRLVAGTGKDQG